MKHLRLILSVVLLLLAAFCCVNNVVETQQAATPEPYIKPDSAFVSQSLAFTEAMGLSLKVNPNPANTWVTVDYTLPEGFSNAVVTLTNNMGLEVYTQNVHGERGQHVINLQKLPVGVYILTIKCEEHRLTEKVVVTR
ncbi:MAG: T9SS type A sorting domain-containing protein [Bacteroidales bacterium]|nr:T9SS type A sorting domain-containing protein [Bacteroidales bacterium]